MRTYTFRLVIKEGKDQFWKELDGDGVSAVQGELIKNISEYGWDVEKLVLMKYEYEPEEYHDTWNIYDSQD